MLSHRQFLIRKEMQEQRNKRNYSHCIVLVQSIGRSFLSQRRLCVGSQFYELLPKTEGSTLRMVLKEEQKERQSLQEKYFCCLRNFFHMTLQFFESLELHIRAKLVLHEKEERCQLIGLASRSNSTR